MSTQLNQNVEQLREARGLTSDQLSSRLGLTQQELRSALAAEKVREGLIQGLARELLVDDFVLFMSNPDIHDVAIVDFRQATPSLSNYERDTLKAISRASHIQNSANSLGYFVQSNSIERHISSANHPFDAAKKLRIYLNISIEDQFRYVDSRVFYNDLRSNLEKFELFVLQDSFSDGSGFCLSSHQGFDVILVNTLNQNYSRRLFTLVHEAYHCILNNSGLSDSTKLNNDLEILCNKFAIEFLAPAELVGAAAKYTISSRRFDLGELSNFAKISKLSLEASVYRLVELGVYSKDAVASWKSYLKTLAGVNIDKKQRGRRVEEWKYKLARYGTKTAAVFGRANNEGLIDDVDVFRITGIKPKYQRDYFLNAVKSSASDADDE